MSNGDPSPDSGRGRRLPSLRAVLLTLGGLAVLAALILLIEPVRDAAGDAVTGDTTSLRRDLRDLGFGGVLVVLVLAALHAVIFYPAEILDAAAGFVYGFGLALPLMMLAWLLNALICHQVGMYAARPLLIRLTGDERFDRYEGLVARGGVILLLGMRLIPIIPFSLFSYVAGSARVPLWTFAWTTLVGYLPITALFVYLGSNLEELSPTDPILVGGGIALIAAALLSRWLFRRADARDRPLATEQEPEPEIGANAGSEA